MKSDIRKYLSLRDALVQERAQLESRLREITTALGETSETSTAGAAARTSAPAARIQTPQRRAGRGRRDGGLSLREAVLQVTASGPRTKEEILNGIKQLGYKFSTNNPLNSLGVILYGKNPRFKNEGGRFSPMGSTGSAAAKSQPAARKGGGGKRRTLSPEARERIAAAQRARWAKAKSGK